MPLRLFVLIGALLAFVLVASPGLTQDATPVVSESPLAAMGYPELRIEATDAGFEAPTEVAAGRHLVVLENAARSAPYAEEGADVQIFQLPTGVTPAEVQAAFAEEEAPVPSWFFEAAWAGGPFAFPGQTGRFLLDLAPGEWYVSVGRSAPKPLAVTGGAATPEAAAAPEAVVAVQMHEMAFGLPSELPAGPQVWEVINTGAQPHHIVLARSPEPLTAVQALVLLSLPEGSTPPPGVPDVAAELEFLAGVQVMSAGRTGWAEFDLGPGHYVAICFMPDEETGTEHVYQGMVDAFAVGDGGTPRP